MLYFLLLKVFVCEVFMLSIATKMFARVEDAVHGLCSCSSFSGSCFRPFRRYVSFRNFCVGGQSIHVTFSTRAADMYTDMPIVDRGATTTSGIRAQNVFYFPFGGSRRGESGRACATAASSAAPKAAPADSMCPNSSTSKMSVSLCPSATH